MSDPVHLYISAATDLEVEREILGRSVTEIPVDLGWQISQSPRRSEPLNEAALARADVHLLLLGGDVRAPIGQEWLTARQAGRQPVPFLKRDARRTPAALEFVRFIRRQADWRPFGDVSELRREALTLLSRHILRRATTYALSPTEVDHLETFLEELESAPADVDVQTRGGAGESSVILSRERFEPSGGVLIEDE